MPPPQFTPRRRRTKGPAESPAPKAAAPDPADLVLAVAVPAAAAAPHVGEGAILPFEAPVQPGLAAVHTWIEQEEFENMALHNRRKYAVSRLTNWVAQQLRVEKADEVQNIPAAQRRKTVMRMAREVLAGADRGDWIARWRVATAVPNYVYSVVADAEAEGGGADGRFEWSQQAFLTYNSSAWVVQGDDGEAKVWNETDVDLVAASIRDTPLADELTEALLEFVTSLREKLPITGWAFALELCPDTLKDCMQPKGATWSSEFPRIQVDAGVLAQRWCHNVFNIGIFAISSEIAVFRDVFKQGLLRMLSNTLFVPGANTSSMNHSRTAGVPASTCTSCCRQTRECGLLQRTWSFAAADLFGRGRSTAKRCLGCGIDGRRFFTSSSRRGGTFKAKLPTGRFWTSQYRLSGL